MLQRGAVGQGVVEVAQPGWHADAQARGVPTRPAGDREHRDRAEGRLRALTEIGRAAMTADRDRGLEAIMRAARLALGGASISLGVWQPDERVLRTVLNEGDLAAWEERRPRDEAYPADQSTWLAGMADGHLGLTMRRDDPDLPVGEQEFLDLLGKHSSLTVPLLKHGEWWGEVFVARRADQPPFTDTDLDWASAVAAQVAAALEAMDQLAHAATLARTDALTGLANRLAVNEWMTGAMARWRDEGAVVALVVCDVNGLKQVNDTQGHDVGDLLLVRFARQLDHIAAEHPVALLARLGGDEFCLAFTDTDSDVVVAAAEEVARRGWETVPHGVAVGVAVTAGEAGPVESVSELFRLADAAQYRAKNSGSRHAVVAGRAVPEDAAVALRPAEPPRTGDRRLLRGPHRHDVGGLVDVTVRSLDEAADEPVRVRLALVCDLVAQHVDAAGWWLSVVLPGSDALQTAQFRVYRSLRGLTPDDIATELTGAFPIAEYTSSARALTGRGFQVLADDPLADPAERETLAALGASGMAAAGVREDDGTTWLLEVFTDRLSGSLAAIPSALRLLGLAAVRPPMEG